MSRQPNVVFVFADQWRRHATGYAGNPDVRTPNLDALARESVHFTHALAGCPVCSPYRGCLLTGQRPLTHGVFVNDVPLEPKGPCLAEVFADAGYDTAYVGKWHLDGRDRSAYIPPHRRRGFNYWKAFECSHDYNHSPYYAGNSEEKLYWDGYDAQAQTDDIARYIRAHSRKAPFLLVLSWGPPHAPYNTAPQEYRDQYDPHALQLRENVPEALAPAAREWLAGYYAHCSALDACVGRIRCVLREAGIERDTIFVFTSDHGDMLGSQGHTKKQRPWDESIRVPFLLCDPGRPGWRPAETDAPIDAPDIMPTLLGLCGIEIPDSVEGIDFSDHIAGGADPSDGTALLMCPHPFGQYNAAEHQGKEYRGLRTRRYTYVRDREGPWLLYDNRNDPFQMQNRIDDPSFASLSGDLDALLQKKLRDQHDEFRPGMEYIHAWGYPVDESGTVPYTE